MKHEIEVRRQELISLACLVHKDSKIGAGQREMVGGLMKRMMAQIPLEEDISAPTERAEEELIQLKLMQLHHYISETLDTQIF